MRFALASLAIASLAMTLGGARDVEAAATPSWAAPSVARASAPIASASWGASLGCSGCIDVKLAPAPVRYRRAARWRSKFGRARHGRVLRVRG